MAKPAKLDTTRSFGTVYGGGRVRYEQDHKQFDATGREIEAGVTPPLPQPVDTVADASALDDMTMAQLRACYTDRTGKRARVGINKAQLRQLIKDTYA